MNRQSPAGQQIGNTMGGMPDAANLRRVLAGDKAGFKPIHNLFALNVKISTLGLLTRFFHFLRITF
jgi:hypothetical protein